MEYPKNFTKKIWLESLIFKYQYQIKPFTQSKYQLLYKPKLDLSVHSLTIYDNDIIEKFVKGKRLYGLSHL